MNVPEALRASGTPTLSRVGLNRSVLRSETILFETDSLWLLLSVGVARKNNNYCFYIRNRPLKSILKFHDIYLDNNWEILIALISIFPRGIECPKIF